MKLFHNSPLMLQTNRLARRRVLPIAVIAVSLCGISVAGWEARAALPRWMQDAIGGSAIEGAFYRVMDLPGVKALYPRPPKEAQEQLNGLIGKAPGQVELYSLRAMEEERALDFHSAEADWKNYASRSKDAIGAKLELADYYHRRLRATEEIKSLMETGSMPVQSSERYTAPTEQRSWKAFERLLLVVADQMPEKGAGKGLHDEVLAKAYAAWIARYPQQSSLYAREFRWLLDEKNFDRAGDVIIQYRKAFPKDLLFPLKATALMEYRRGSSRSIEKSLMIYDRGFEPLWPAELVESYYALLAQTHQQRKFLTEARARLAQNPDDLNAMARLFYYSQQQGNLPGAQQIAEAYRLSKDNRKAGWSAQELYTLAQLMEAIHAYPEAARYYFALYHATGKISSGASAQAEGLSGVIRLLVTVPDQPMELGSGNLSMYRDIATLDRGPGYWNGILSLWLNSLSPEQAYVHEEERARPYFHRAKAAELLALLDKKYPDAVARADLHKEVIRAFAEYGENALVIKAGSDYLGSFSTPSDEANRVLVAMYMADAYARQRDMKGEFALYDRMLAELGAKTAGMPLTAAAASHQGAAVSSTPDQDTGVGNNMPSTSTTNTEKTPAFEVNVSSPAGDFVAGSQEYQQLLERYLGRLTATGQLPQALAVLRGELDRNPNDPLLYERLATFLEQNNLSAQQEEVYRQAIQKFQDKGWYDKLARLYLREKKREAFAGLSKQVTDIFHGTDLEEYFAHVSEGGPQLFLQLNLYAQQRFPHDQVFVQNLLSAYEAPTTRDQAAWEKLMREHWADSEQLRARFFDYLSRSGKLDAELKGLHELVPGAREQKENPAAGRELAEVEMWRSHFEESAAPLGLLAEAYPADEEIGTQASSLFRSLAYFDTKQTEHAVAIEKNLLISNPGDADRLARIGDIYADSGADAAPDHEDIAAASPYWRRMPAVHPGSTNGYLQAATVFWDYFQFDEALGEIHDARKAFDQPVLFGYEAGAIYEGRRDLPKAISEYTAAITHGDTANELATQRLLQLARRKTFAKMVDEETARAVEAKNEIPALELRERVLETQKRGAEIGPLLETFLRKATTFEEAQAIGSQAQTRSLAKIYELALQREIAFATDPVQKIELSYELLRSFEGRKDLDDATRLIEQVYRENPKLLGVVRATTDFYWKNKESTKAINTLIEAANAAKATQPVLSRQFVLEAADKANESGSYAQARSLMAPLIDVSSPSDSDPYNVQYLAVVADSYARQSDDAGLKQFYLDKLAAIRSTTANVTADERKQKTALLRRGLIPALTRMKDYAGAVDQYIAILSAYPEDANTIREASLYSLRYSRQQQLLEFVDNTVKASPRDSHFAIMLAQIQTTFENLPAAIDAYAHAITIRADRADVYASKADLEERLQRLDDACKEYERLYVLSYQNPDWMVKVAAARARQGRKDEAVRALQRAWIDGHPVTAVNYFRVATQLETWNMLDEAERLAELGVKAEGDDLLAGGGTGNQNGDEPQGAVIYARLMTRLRRVDKAFAVLDSARKTADVSAYSPGIVVEQVQKQGLASVTNDEWRKQRIEQRKTTAEQRFRSAVVEMGKTVGTYGTPEEKQQFAQLIDGRWKADAHASVNQRLVWIDVAKAAGIADEEASLRKQVLLDGALRGASADSQYDLYVQLQNSRMEYSELAQTLEAYALTLQPKRRTVVRAAEAEAYRKAGDETSELSALGKIGFTGDNRGDLRERYLQLLLKRDPARFEAYGSTSKDGASAFAAPNYAVEHGDVKIARASVNARAKTFGGPLENAYSALLGLYFHDLSAGTEGAFHSVLGDKSIGERIDRAAQSAHTPGTHAVEPQELAGGVWFYYGMRYGVYRSLSPEKDWSLHDPEDFLAADLERNPSAAGYVGLARAYADVGKTATALIEYRHALELGPDSPAVHDAMAMLLWRTHDDSGRSAAVAEWREALAALNHIQEKGAAPESFWSGFALISQHLGSRKLVAQLHSEMDAVLRSYIARNGNYRSTELLASAFKASASNTEGVEWILSLSAAASNPAGVLADLDTAPWLPNEAREPIFLREIELARIAAAHTDSGGSYLAERVGQLGRSLFIFYVGQKEDAKAEVLFQKMSDEQRRDNAIVPAQIELAAHNKTLNTLLARYRTDAENTQFAPGLQLLRNAAGKLVTEGDKADALAIWEFVFEQGQTRQDLMASDFLGLADARLELSNVGGAVEVLHWMTLLPCDISSGNELANYDLAAGLLEKKGRDAEAIEFLLPLAKGVPWNASFGLRLAEAQLRISKDKAQAVAALETIAADGRSSYDLRVAAANALKRSGGSGAKPGSEELALLAGGKVSAQQAEQPYFTAARIAAANAMSDTGEKAKLLREAIAIRPGGFAGSSDFSGDALRVKIFRAEVAAGHDATALDAIRPLLDGSYSYAVQATDNGGNPEVADTGAGSDQPENYASVNGDDAVDESVNLSATDGNDSTPAQLRRLAPLPARVIKSDAERLELALLISGVYERTDSAVNALPYLKLAAYLQKDPALHADAKRSVDLQPRIDRISTDKVLEGQNALRRPKIQRALDQSSIVRPKLTAGDLTRIRQEEAQ